MSEERVTYTKDDHGIDPQHIETVALYVIEKLQQEGHSAYLVGGGVRDLLCRRQPKDFDVSTSAKPEEIKKIFGRKCLLIGRRFRLAHVRFGKKIIEVSTFRSLQTGQGELIVDDNVFGSASEDALRRDFTLNALFYDPSEELVIDYTGGYLDLKRNELKCIGDPYVRFKEDPVRMVRLIKFSARFNFSIDPLMQTALEDLKEEITKSAEARILEELLRMLESGYSEPFFRQSSACGLLSFISPSLDALLQSEEGETVFKYLQLADKVQKKYGQSALDRSCLLTCFIFPSLEKHLKSLSPPPHLGQTTLLAHTYIRDLLTASFTRFPKRLSAFISDILVDQWRLTPLTKRKTSRSRFLSSKSFTLSLKFLKIRSLIDPTLKPIYQEWRELYQQHMPSHERVPHEKHFHHPKSRRKRKRVHKT